MSKFQKWKSIVNRKREDKIEGKMEWQEKRNKRRLRKRKREKETDKKNVELKRKKRKRDKWKERVENREMDNHKRFSNGMT